MVRLISTQYNPDDSESQKLNTNTLLVPESAEVVESPVPMDQVIVFMQLTDTINVTVIYLRSPGSSPAAFI